MIAFDTNVLLRVFLHDNDPAQSARAQRALKDNAPVFVDEIVLAEFVWTCQRTFKQSRADIHKRLEAIVEAPEFALARPELVARAVAGYGSRKSDFADWLIGESARANGCEATLTFDTGAAGDGAFRRLEE